MNKSNPDIREEARLHTDKMIKRLVKLAHHAKRERDQFAAVKLFFDYAWGIPPPCYPGEEEEGPLQIVISATSLGI